MLYAVIALSVLLAGAMIQNVLLQKRLSEMVPSKTVEDIVERAAKDREYTASLLKDAMDRVMAIADQTGTALMQYKSQEGQEGGNKVTYVDEERQAELERTASPNGATDEESVEPS